MAKSTFTVMIDARERVDRWEARRGRRSDSLLRVGEVGMSFWRARHEVHTANVIRTGLHQYLHP
jgi:hypothetical protein